MNIEEFLKSETFLRGKPTVTSREVSFGGFGSWSWRVVETSVFPTAIRHTKGRVTLWQNFHDEYIGRLHAAVGTLETHAARKFYIAARDNVFEISDILTGHTKIAEFSVRLAAATGLDESMLRVSHSSCAFFYTVAALAVLSPHVQYDGLHVALDAYNEGLFPFGLLDILSDPDHDGYPVILCLDPANLSADCH